MPHLSPNAPTSDRPPIVQPIDVRALDEIRTGHTALVGICDLLASETSADAHRGMHLVTKGHLVTLLDLVAERIAHGLAITETR